MEKFWEFIKKLAGLSDLEAWRSLEMAVAILDTSVYIDHWEGDYIKTDSGSEFMVAAPRNSADIFFGVGHSMIPRPTHLEPEHTQ
jgi:hypothetical protein